VKRGILVLTLLSLAGPARADSDEVPFRPIRLAAAGERITLSCDVPRLGDQATRRRLRAGSTVRLVLRAYLFDAEEDTAVAAMARTVEVRYDLWDEDFRISEHLPSGTTSRRVARADEVERLVSSLTDLAAFDRSRLRARRKYYVAVVAEVDPLSDEQLSEVRRWLSRPQAGHRDLALGGRSFLGSFVSLFVNVKVGEAARVVRFRSEPFAARDVAHTRAPGGAG